MSDVRTHRPFSPNRRPLLTSALLVALTSVPTMIVVAVGSATLDSAPPSRAPIVAEPRPGPVVVDSSPASGLHPSGVPDRHSMAAVPTAPKPPARPRITARASGGTGGGFSVGTGTRAPSSPAVEASPPAPPAPPAAAAPPSVTAPSEEAPIRDRAWPGWDSELKGKGEAAWLDTARRRHAHRQPARWRRSPSGSVDRSDPAGRSPVCIYLPARVLELRVTTAQAVENGLHGH